MKTIKYKYTCIPDSYDPRDQYFTGHLSLIKQRGSTLPKNVDLSSFMKNVFDQGNIGSTSVIAIATLFDFEFAKVKDSNSDFDIYFNPSILFIYYNTRFIERSFLHDYGCQIRNTLRALTHFGVCSTTSWPYIPEHVIKKPPNSCYLQGFNFLNKINPKISFKRINVQSLDFKATLHLGHIIAFRLNVYESFENIGPDGILKPPLSSEKCLGAIAVVAVGYDDNLTIDDSTGYFKIRNSFGPNWGHNGYFWMNKNYFNYIGDPWIILF
jgi:C1A family cysteine protease